MRHQSAASRTALTLLEVVLALAILAGSFATLAQLVGLGMRAAGDSRDLTQAQLLAESVMSEIVAGILPAENLNRVPMDTHPGWYVSAGIDTTLHQGILRVTVLAERESESYRSVRYQLSRWIRDPNLALPTEEEEEEATDDTSNRSGSSASTSGSSTPNSGTSGNPPAGNTPAPPAGAAPPPPARGGTSGAGGNTPRRTAPAGGRRS